MDLRSTVIHRLSTIEPQIQSVEVPRYTHGDYTTNIAFSFAKKLKKSPIQIASALADRVNAQRSILSATAESGFLNITINDDALYDYFLTCLDTPCQTASPKTMLLEYVSANPTGPLHIGHGRWAVIGDCLARLLTRVGHSVDREFYVNDAGNQIRLFNDSIEAVRNNKVPPEDGYHGDFIQFVAASNGDDSHVSFTMNYQKDVLNKLLCVFDDWFLESSLLSKGAIRDQLTQYFQPFMVEKDGAVWFRTTDFGDDKDRVLIKASGDFTYFAMDALYHAEKINRNYDVLMNIWGADHHGYIERIKAVIQAIRPGTKFSVILGQVVHLFNDGGPLKMSKRTGDIVALDDVMNDIGVDATRFFLVNRKPELTLDFDLNLAKKDAADNPVYYIQYAHARICTILDKCTALPLAHSEDLTLNTDARRLVLHVCRYHETLLDAAERCEPYKVSQYLYDCAKLFHSFYQTNRVINQDTVSPVMHAIVSVVKRVLCDAADILGVSMPTKM